MLSTFSANESRQTRWTRKHRAEMLATDPDGYRASEWARKKAWLETPAGQSHLARRREESQAKAAARRAIKIRWQKLTQAQRDAENLLRRQRNNERFHQQNRDARLAYLKTWREENRDRKRALDRKREALKRGNAVGDQDAVIAFYRFVRTTESIECYLCGKSVPRADRHVDHVIPLAKGGAHSIKNLACACKTCNLKKGRKLIPVVSQ